MLCNEFLLVLPGKFTIISNLLFKDFQHIIGVGILDKGTALFQNPVQGSIAHEKAGIGLFVRR